jgi:hypothetical protein
MGDVLAKAPRIVNKETEAKKLPSVLLIREEIVIFAVKTASRVIAVGSDRWVVDHTLRAVVLLTTTD